MSTVQKVPLIQQIEATRPHQLVALPDVAQKFKHIYSVMNGGNVQKAEIKYEAEKFHFMKLLQDKPDLQQCSKLSLYGCFMDMAVNGLSFDPAMKHAYIVAFNTNVGTRDVPKWEKRATLMISGYGELSMRINQGQIKYADNPVLVYEGDLFKCGTRNNRLFLEHEATFPRQSDNIIACYLRLERNDGSVDYKVMSIEEVMKLKAFSKDPKSLAWGNGLPGMVQAKTIKHAFRSYPKIRMGDFSTLQSQVVDADADVTPPIDYGLNGHTPGPANVGIGDIVQPAEIVTKHPTAQQQAGQTPAGKPAVDDESFNENPLAQGGSAFINDDDF